MLSDFNCDSLNNFIKATSFHINWSEKFFASHSQVYTNLGRARCFDKGILGISYKSAISSAC